ncbi:hypothetical protein K435DRAFT_844414 [Dendrothele bispora CBS 962.96]|uniref:F-box domain-containing protein n=1 Tax=Dendrothele bispora (strain CBS 962.96) TaxID=1314807 RepID=A0A4S8L266_DENBC|nr:hypothetical protein K435DRAFT_844414 [Dendrothele bispora CBS 962.96]
MSQKRSSSQLEIIMNPQVHIHKIPIEILTKIFKECCEMEVYLYKGVPAPLILAQVCRNWHRILIGGPIIPSPRRVTSSSTPLPLSPTSTAVLTSTPTPTTTPTPTSTLALTPTATPRTAALQTPFQPWQHSPNPRLWSCLEFTLPSIDSEDPHRLFPPPHVILNQISRYLALSSRPPISSSSSSSCSPSSSPSSPYPSSRSSSSLPPVPLNITIKNGAARGPCDSDPIEMYARYPVRDDPYPEEILDTLNAHVERIERLSMQVPWGWVWRWGRRGGQRRTTNRALLLKSFSISITNDFPYSSTLALSHPAGDRSDSTDPGFLPILRTAPNLTSLALRAWSGEMLRILDFVPLHWGRLVDLELKMVGTRETQGLMEMLREGRRLERVRVVVDEWSGDELEGGVEGEATTPWVLPRLKVLEIEFLRRVCTERFLEPFAFPRLEELVIKHEKNSWGGGDMGGTLVGLMRRSHGSIWCGDSGGGGLEEEEDLSAVNSAAGLSTPTPMPMPMLTTTTLPLRKVELRFNQSSDLSGKDLVEFVSGVSDTLTHLDCSSYVEESSTLLDALTASDARPVVIAPNLRELGITTGKYRQEEVDRLWEFIESRWCEEEVDGDHQNDNDAFENVNSHRLTVPLHHLRLILTKDISGPVRKSLSWQNILLPTRNGRDRFVFEELPRTLEQGFQPRALSRGDTFDNLDCDSLSEVPGPLVDKFWKGVGYSISRARGRSGMRKGPRKLGDCYYEESIASTTSSRASTPVGASGSGSGGGGPHGPGESDSGSQPVYWTQSQSQSQSQSQTSTLGLGRRDSEISFTSLFTQERSRSRSVSRALALSREGTEEEVLTPRHDTTPRNSAGAPSRVGSTSEMYLCSKNPQNQATKEFLNFAGAVGRVIEEQKAIFLGQKGHWPLFLCFPRRLGASWRKLSEQWRATELDGKQKPNSSQSPLFKLNFAVHGAVCIQVPQHDLRNPRHRLDIYKVIIDHLVLYIKSCSFFIMESLNPRIDDNIFASSSLVPERARIIRCNGVFEPSHPP